MSANSLIPASTPSPMADQIPAEVETASVQESKGHIPLWRPFVLLILTLLTVFAYWYNPPMNVQPQAGVIMKLPIIVGDFFGKEGEITDVEHRILPPDTEFQRRYYTDTQRH